MFCLNCNAALPEHAGVCGRCGMPVNNASPNRPFSQIDRSQTPFPYQNAPTGHSGGPADYRQDFPGHSQGSTGYSGPMPLGTPTAQGGSALPYSLAQSYGPAQSFPSQQDPMQQSCAASGPQSPMQQPGMTQAPSAMQQPQPAMQQPQQPMPQAPASDTPFGAYLGKVSARLQTPPTYIPELSSYLMVNKRFSGALANIHQFFFLTQNDACNGAMMQQFTEGCVSFALNNYKGAPRGLQKGIGIYPVMCQTAPSPEVISYTKRKPDAHFSAFVLSCSVNLSTGWLEYLDKTPVWGMAMWRGIKNAAKEALQY